MSTAVVIFIIAILFAVIGTLRAKRSTSDGDYVFLLWWFGAAITCIVAAFTALFAFLAAHV